MIAAGLLCLSLGLHWVVLQSVAWTSMLIERSWTTSFAEAVTTTFDGEHPCRLCSLVQAGARAEASSNKSGAPKSPKLDMASLPSLAWMVLPRAAEVTEMRPFGAPVQRTEAPLLPPPRPA